MISNANKQKYSRGENKMKQTTLSILILFALCAPVSCGHEKAQAQDVVYSASVQENDETEACPFSNAAVNTGFKEGTLDGKVYTSEYAGFRFIGTETMEYMSKDDIYTEQQMRNRFKPQEEKYIIDSETIDASAIDTESNTRAVFTFVDTKKRFPEKTDITPDDLIEKRGFDGSEWIEYNVTEPETVMLGGSGYTKVRVSVDYLPDCATFAYIRMIDNDHALKITYSTDAQDDGSGFESRFEALV